MKKFYFIGLMGLGLIASAQQSTQTSKTGTPMSIKAKQPVIDYDIPSPVRVYNEPATKRSGTQFGKAGVGYTINQKIGSTLFITQTVNSIYRRTYAYADGKVSATWTTSSDNGTKGYLSRGSGYNTFNGTTWANSPNSSPRIESFRTGYPSFNSDGTKEIIVSHRVDTSGLSQGLVINTNTAVGSTTWSTVQALTPPAQTPSLLWPHSVISGDYLIVVANYQDSTQAQPLWVTKSGVQSPMVYSRYKISTSTWVDQEKTLPKYDSDLFHDGNSDIYSIDANGANVAIVCGDKFNNLAFWKSTDNGATWTFKMIDSFPVPHYVFDKDTLNTVSVGNGTNHVLVDNSGKAHVFTGLCRIKDTVMGDGYYTYYRANFCGGVNDGILYWNEYQPDSGLRVIASGINLGGDSSIADGSFTNTDRFYGISNSMWPTAGIDAQGRIFLVYSALTPTDLTTDGSNANYRDILVTYSSDNGASWAYPQNATQFLGTNIEQIYPNAAKFVNDHLHLTYITKTIPGLTVTASNTDPFEVDYMSIPVSEIITNTVGLKENSNDLFTINQNYPNPFHGSTTIDIAFKRSTNATLTIHDVMGKEIYTESFKNVPSGKSSINLQLGSIPAGVYIYTIQADGVSSTQRMIVE